nr:glucokinase [Bradyrhizobium sp.]
MTAASTHRISRKVLLADIGGTNARFALLTGRSVGMIAHMAVGDYGSFHEALGAYLAGLPEAETISAAILAVAGVVRNGRCNLTNNSWVVDAAELRNSYGFSTVRMLNDFEAVAWSLSGLPPEKLLALGGGRPVAGAPLAALGPGTGLGMAACIPHAAGRLVLSSEGGHSTMAGSTSREDAVIAWLRRRLGHVSAEHVLSGSGLEHLHEALAALDHVALPRRRAAEITRAGVEGTCPTSRAAIDLFCAMLGTVAGNLALTLGARGGVFIAGGILRHMPEYLVGSQFRARFDDKGRLRGYLEPIPIWLILDQDAAFVGLHALAEVEGIG